MEKRKIKFEKDLEVFDEKAKPSGKVVAFGGGLEGVRLQESSDCVRYLRLAVRPMSCRRQGTAVDVSRTRARGFRLAFG